jgi:hypothetical protein
MIDRGTLVLESSVTDHVEGIHSTRLYALLHGRCPHLSEHGQQTNEKQNAVCVFHNRAGRPATLVSRADAAPSALVGFALLKLVVQFVLDCF